MNKITNTKIFINQKHIINSPQTSKVNTVNSYFTCYQSSSFALKLVKYDTDTGTGLTGRATGNSRFENAKFPPAKEKIPENSRSVKYLILHNRHSN